MTLVLLVFGDARLLRYQPDCSADGRSSCRSQVYVLGGVATYSVRTVIRAFKSRTAVKTGKHRTSTLIAVRIKFLLGQHISTVLPGVSMLMWKIV